jgi:hypothetical protein
VKLRGKRKTKGGLGVGILTTPAIMYSEKYETLSRKKEAVELGK